MRTLRRTDIIIPGQPEEAWLVGFKHGVTGRVVTKVNAGANERVQVLGHLTDTSAAPRLSASWAGTAGDCLQVQQNYSIAHANSRMVEVDVALKIGRASCRERVYGRV